MSSRQPRGTILRGHRLALSSYAQLPDDAGSETYRQVRIRAEPELEPCRQGAQFGLIIK